MLARPRQRLAGGRRRHAVADEAIVAYLKRFRAERPVGGIVGRARDRGPLLLHRRHRRAQFRARHSARSIPFSIGCCAIGEVPRRLRWRFSRRRSRNCCPASTRRMPSTCCSTPDRVPRIWIGNRIQVAPHYDLMENIGVRRRRAAALHRLPARAIGQPLSGPVRAHPGRHADQPGRPPRARSRSLPALSPKRLATAQTAVLEPGDAHLPALPLVAWRRLARAVQLPSSIIGGTTSQPGLGSPYDALIHALYALRHLPPRPARRVAGGLRPLHLLRQWRSRRASARPMPRACSARRLRSGSNACAPPC